MHQSDDDVMDSSLLQPSQPFPVRFSQVSTATVAPCTRLTAGKEWSWSGQRGSWWLGMTVCRTGCF